MTKREEYESKTEALLQPLIDANHFELVDVEYVKEGGNYFLRAYIDKEGGITIDDCELISRALSDILDEKDFIPELGRQLKKDKDFKRSLGEEVEIKLYKPIEKKKELIGLLENFDAENLYLTTEESEELLTVSRKNIAMVRLTFDF